MKTSFPHVESYSIPAPSWLRTKPGSANLIFFAGPAPLHMDSEAFSLATITLLNQGKMPPEVLPFLNSAKAPDWNPGLILTDDFSRSTFCRGVARLYSNRARWQKSVAESLARPGSRRKHPGEIVHPFIKQNIPVR